MGNITLEQIAIIYLLMFADDAVLISDSKDGLQNLLVQFEIYSNKWQLTVNIEKTKIMIFQKGGRIPNDIFIYNGEHIEIAKEFNYLGYVVSCGGSCKSNGSIIFNPKTNSRLLFKMLL